VRCVSRRCTIAALGEEKMARTKIILDDEASEILDQLNEKIEIAYEEGDWMLVDHLERVMRNFIRNERRHSKRLPRSKLDMMSDEQRVDHFLGQVFK
jgi:ArsR family metal-binding transcriptional regulator